MRRGALVVLLGLTIMAPPRRTAAERAPAALSDAEEAFCAAELEVLDKRRRVFEAQGLPEAEIARRNEQADQDLAACRKRFKGEARRAAELKADEAELRRRAGPDATREDRQQLWREIRRDRLVVKPASSLTDAERAELAEVLGDDASEAKESLDLVHSRDPAFMRQVHSALACYHRDRKEELQAALDEESAHVRLGSGDRQRVYALRSELKRSDEVLERVAEESAAYAGGLIRCGDTRTAILARCLAIRFDRKPAEPACEAEDVQQYVRFVK